MSDTRNALKTIISRNVLLIFAIQFFQNLSAVMGGTYVGPLGKATGLSVSLIGVAATLYTVFGMLTRGPAARMTAGDKKKLALVIGIGGRGVVFMLMGVFEHNPAVYMVLRCLQGITWSIIGVVLVSCMAMIVDKKVMGTAYAIFSAMLSIGKIFAKPIAQKVYMEYGFLAISAVTFACAMVATVLIFFLDFKDPGLKPVPSKKNHSLNPFSGLLLAAIPIALIGGIPKLGYTTDSVYTSIMTVENGLDPTAAFAVSGAISAVVGLVIGVVCDFVGPKWVTVGMLVCNGVGLAMLGQVDSQSGLMIAYVIAMGLGGKYETPIRVMIMKTVPREKQGSAEATRLLFNDIFSAIAGTLVGGLIAAAGYQFSFGVVGAASALCGLAMLVFSRKILGALEKGKEAAAQ